MKKMAALLIIACLMSLTAACAEVLPRNPAFYIGAWEGGESYGEAHEYYIDITDYRDGWFTLDFDIYRIWSFDDMSAMLMDDAPAAVVMTGAEDDYAVMGILSFGANTLTLEILESDYPELPAGTIIDFV